MACKECKPFLTDLTSPTLFGLRQEWFSDKPQMEVTGVGLVSWCAPSIANRSAYAEYHYRDYHLAHWEQSHMTLGSCCFHSLQQNWHMLHSIGGLMAVMSLGHFIHWRKELSWW